MLQYYISYYSETKLKTGPGTLLPGVCRVDYTPNTLPVKPQCRFKEESRKAYSRVC